MDEGWDDYTVTTLFEKYVGDLERYFLEWNKQDRGMHEGRIEYGNMQLVLIYSHGWKEDSLCRLKKSLDPRDLVENGMVMLFSDHSWIQEVQVKQLLSGLYLALGSVGWNVPVFVRMKPGVFDGVFCRTYWWSREYDLGAYGSSLLEKLGENVYKQARNMDVLDSLMLKVDGVYIYRTRRQVQEQSEQRQGTLDEEYFRLVQRVDGWMDGEIAWMYTKNLSVLLELDLSLKCEVQDYVFSRDKLDSRIGPVDMLLKINVQMDALPFTMFCQQFRRGLGMRNQAQLLSQMEMDDHMVEYHRSMLERYVWREESVEGQMEMIMRYVLYCYVEERERTEDILRRIVCDVWRAFVELVKEKWRCRESISKERKKTNLADPLIVQKLWFLNECIHKTLMTNDDHNEDDFYDPKDDVDRAHGEMSSEDEVSDDMEEIVHRKGQKGILGGDERLVGNSREYLYVPYTQEYPRLTRDRLEENVDMMARIIDDGDETVKVKVQSEQLVLDIQAFKAANPHGCFEDFVRWYSPKDWNESTKQLSTRMAENGKNKSNVWLMLWKELDPCPASEQPPIFNYKQEGDKIVYDLEHHMEIGHVYECVSLLFDTICNVLSRFVESTDQMKNCDVLQKKTMTFRNMLEIFPWNSPDIVIDDPMLVIHDIEQTILMFLGTSRVFPGFSIECVNRIVDRREVALDCRSEDSKDVLETFKGRNGKLPMPDGEKYRLRMYCGEEEREICECIYVSEENECPTMMVKTCYSLYNTQDKNRASHE